MDQPIRPKNEFTWGVASASYQIEGTIPGDGRGPSVWDTFCQTPGKVRNGDSGDVTCSHITHMQEDVDLIAGLEVDAYRFSVSWSRILPEGSGAINPKGVEFYDRLVDALLDKGVVPWVTLYHWDMPEAIFRKGGWLNRRSIEAFEEYTRILVNRLGDRVKHWMPLNEPQVFYGLGHALGTHAPGAKYSNEHLVPCIHHGLVAHGRAIEIIRAESRVNPVIGCANYGEVCMPASSSEEDIEAARLATNAVPDSDFWCFNNSWYADPMVLGHYPEEALLRLGQHLPKGFEQDMETIHQPLDFYGVNIYQGKYVTHTEDGPKEVPHSTGIARTSFGWPIVPEALYWGPAFLSERYKLPIVITENGCAMPDWVHLDGAVNDPNRIDFLSRYIGAFLRSQERGVDCAGYFQWSILDNLEWAEGFSMRFGIVHVDFETLVRTPKASYHWYREFIRQHRDGIDVSQNSQRSVEMK